MSEHIEDRIAELAAQQSSGSYGFYAFEDSNIIKSGTYSLLSTVCDTVTVQRLCAVVRAARACADDWKTRNTGPIGMLDAALCELDGLQQDQQP